MKRVIKISLCIILSLGILSGLVWLSVVYDDSNSFLFGKTIVSGAQIVKEDDMGNSLTNPITVKMAAKIKGIVNSYGNYETEDKLTINDNSSLYKDDDFDVEVMYLTVQKGSSSDGADHTWKEVNENSAYYYSEFGIERYKVDGILQIGDEEGPTMGSFGYGSVVPNVTVTIRGQTSTRYAQKNYKIIIKDGKGSYDSQTVINLNKHQGDKLRFRNKLCYDLMEQIPDMMSAKTRFVHLYVRDLTEGKDEGFVDYGLYTQVEQINKTYLQNHGLDKKGQLYKINFFEFYRYPESIKLKGDTDYNVEEFERYIEIKGSDEHEKLIRMLEELNDYSNNIDAVISKWFDEDNLLTWLAFHILVGNTDTQSRNAFIYSPLDVDKWYFISWDNDVAFSKTERKIIGWHDGEEWESGVSNYWGNVLFQRMLKSVKYRNKLDDKINELRKIITPQKIQDMAQGYDLVVSNYIKNYPDINYLAISLKDRQQIIDNLAMEVEQNYDDYLTSLEKPMPFYIGLPQYDDGEIKFTWDASFDFDNEDIFYTFELDDDYDFTSILYSDIVYNNNIRLPFELGPGKYFIRVKARNESGYEQYAFDYYSADTGKVYGARCFYVLEDGSLKEDSYVE